MIGFVMSYTLFSGVLSGYLVLHFLGHIYGHVLRATIIIFQLKIQRKARLEKLSEHEISDTISRDKINLIDYPVKETDH